MSAYERLGRERAVRDHTARWEALTPIGSAPDDARPEIERFCDSKRITFDALEALGARVLRNPAMYRDVGWCLAYPGTNDRGRVVAIKYRPLRGTSHDCVSEAPSTWLNPLVIGKRDSLDWLVAEGETDAARLYGLVGDRCAILVLPCGALTFKPEWARRIPRGAHVALCLDADGDGDTGADKAARIIGGDTRRIRPPVKDWCEWDGDREAFLKLAGATSRTNTKLRVLDTREMLTKDPPPLEWLADGIFARGHHTLFGGREKRGKSLVQWVLALKMASGGGEVAGIAVKAGRVLVIDAENGKSLIWRRLRALGLPVEAAENLVIHEARGVELREDLGLVAELARQHCADLVLLDSFRSMWGGKERDDGEVTDALQPVTDLAHDLGITAISTTHHAQKGGEEYRGSTAIGACPDWIVMLDVIAEDPERETRRRLTNPGARIAAQRSERWLRICSEGDDGPTWLEVAEPYEYEHAAPVRNEIEAAVRDVIQRGCGGVASIYGDHTPHPSWSTADLARAVGRDPKDWTVRQAVKHLAELGVLHRNGDGDNRWHPSPSLWNDDNEEGNE